MSNSKLQMLQYIKQRHEVAIKAILKLAPEKMFFILLVANFHGQENSFNTVKRNNSRIAAIHKTPPLTTETELMRSLGQ